MLWDETSSSDGLSNSYYFIHHPEKSGEHFESGEHFKFEMLPGFKMLPGLLTSRFHKTIPGSL
jgi:hypothetical protein